MNLLELKNKFIKSRDYSTEDVNILLDYAKRAYIQNEITIKEYRLLLQELEHQGAQIPDSEKENSLIEFLNGK